MTIAPVVWGSDSNDPGAVAPEVWAEETDGPASSVSVNLPGSDEYPVDLFHVRRGMVGGSLARCWWAFTQGGTTYVVDYTHNGSGADPTTWVSSQSGSTRINVSLASGNRSPTQVAAATVTALGVAGVTGASNVAGQLTVSGASGLVIPPAVDTTDRSLRGMWGAQRDDWGGGTGVSPLNSNGGASGTDGTGAIHLEPLSTHANIPTGRNGRAIGVYLFGNGGLVARLAAGSGPAYSTAPGTITILGEGVAPAASTSGAFVGVGFSEPGALDSDDDLWAIYRGNTGGVPGGVRFRLHGQTVEGRGNLGSAEEANWDTTSTFTGIPAFGSTYTPADDGGFAVYIMIGIIYELEDASGNYYANGAIDDWVGDQNTDDEHGTQFAAGPSLIDPETTWHRFLFPQWQEAPVTQIRRAIDAIDLAGADAEDSRAGIYDFPDLDFPSTVAATLVGDAGLMGFDTADAYNTMTLATPIDVGSDAIGADRYIALGFNYVTSDGSALDTHVLPVFIDAATGDNSYINCWVDERETWHDDIPGASGLNESGTQRAPSSGESEYRTTNTGMPHDSWSQTFPATFVTDATDDSPNAIALEAYRIQRAGIEAA